jgi:hypothetical protein
MDWGKELPSLKYHINNTNLQNGTMKHGILTENK